MPTTELQREHQQQHPHTIDNGGTERITFLGIREDERGEVLDLRSVVAPGAGPPMHVHHRQEEGGVIESGRLGYLVEGGTEQFAGSGDEVSFAAGVVHRFWNAGDEDLVLVGTMRPPGNVEYFLGEVFASTARAGNGRPGLFDAAYLSHRYRTEFAMTDIPAPVRRFVFPVVNMVGRLLGRHRRFAGAPEPLRG